jgi:hypothetical protein
MVPCAMFRWDASASAFMDVTACDCKCYFDGPHNGGVYPPHHWHEDHVCTPRSWDHTVQEEEQRMSRKCKCEEAYQTYIRGAWPKLSDLDLAELGLLPTEDCPMTRTD